MEHAGLLMIAMVAVLAVTGLVVTSTGDNTGAVPEHRVLYEYGAQSQTNVCSCPEGYERQFAGGINSMYCRCHKPPVQPDWA